MKKKYLYGFFFIISFSVSAFAQKALLATGTDVTGSNGSVSYSVGQIDYHNMGSNNEIMEGVQQVYEIITLSTIENSSAEKKGILLYPNPFKDFLFLDFTTNNYKNSEFQLFDSSGKILKSEKITQSKSEFNFSELPSAMYIFRLNQDGKNIKTYKIIKK